MPVLKRELKGFLDGYCFGNEAELDSKLSNLTVGMCVSLSPLLLLSPFPSSHPPLIPPLPSLTHLHVFTAIVILSARQDSTDSAMLFFDEDDDADEQSEIRSSHTFS